jgi:hypothetical protein
VASVPCASLLLFLRLFCDTLNDFVTARGPAPPATVGLPTPNLVCPVTFFERVTCRTGFGTVPCRVVLASLSACFVASTSEAWITIEAMRLGPARLERLVDVDRVWTVLVIGFL